MNDFKQSKKYKKAWIYGKNVLITGAGSGFGKLLCEKLITRYNCKVLGIGRTESKLINLKNELFSLGYDGTDEKGGFDYRTFDVGIEQNWINLKNELLLKGQTIDVLINNAGVLPPFCKYQNLESGMLENTFSANFFACAYSIKHLIDIIDMSRAHAKENKKAKGAIINVSSSAALACVIGTAAYTASKSATAAFTKVLALERPDLYVGLIMPGFSSTSIFRNQAEVSEKEKGLIAKVCGNPDKMTDVMLKRIVKRKKRIVVGADAHAMSVFGKLFPSFTDNAIKNVLKKANLQTFLNVFSD